MHKAFPHHEVLISKGESFINFLLPCCEDAYLLTISDPGYIPVHLPSTHGNDDALQDSPLKRPNPALKLS